MLGGYHHCRRGSGNQGEGQDEQEKHGGGLDQAGVDSGSDEANSNGGGDEDERTKKTAGPRPSSRGPCMFSLQLS